MITDKEVISIGTITRLHGTKGELQCLTSNQLWDDSSATFLVLRLDAILVPFRVLDWRTKGADSLLFSLKGVDTELDAQRLVGAEVFMLRKDAVDGDSDAENLLTWQDLVGFRLLSMDGEDMGTIDSVDESTANILAQTSDGALFPLHEDLILALDEDNRMLQLNLPSQL